MYKVQRNYKDTLFRMIYREREKLLELSLNLYEQQSTVNTNMPLRDLFYVANVLQRLVREYMLYIAKVREYVSCMSVEEAGLRAVDDCIRDGILAEFLARNKSEAIAVSIFEFNEKLYKEELLQEGFEMGKAEGISEGHAQGLLDSLLLLLESFGGVSEELRDEIMSQSDTEVLKHWLKLAVQEKNVDSFVLKYKE